MSDRYFVDERVGCIAVRDREKTDPDRPGLHEDTPGVMHFWPGPWNSESVGGSVPDAYIKAAHIYCKTLNAAEFLAKTSEKAYRVYEGKATQDEESDLYDMFGFPADKDIKAYFNGLHAGINFALSTLNVTN